MKLTVLGCAGSFPGPASSCSSYLVQADGFDLLLDLGSGSFGPLQRHLDPAAIDAVLVSHSHDDHWADLGGFGVFRSYHPGGALPTLPVWGPPDLAPELDHVLGVDHPFRLQPWVPVQQVGPFTVRTVRVNHPVETYAVRLEHDGTSLTYSADTGVCEALVELARDTDLLLCEASYLSGQDNPTDIHLTGAQAGEHATRAGARRLVLTHLVAWNDDRVTEQEAVSTYSGPLTLARTGDVYEV